MRRGQFVSDTTSAEGATASGPVQRVARKIRLHPDVDARAQYWADAAGFPSVNEFMALAVEEKIARMNGDYDLPTLEIQRLNQLIDEMRAISSNVTNLEHVVVNGFDSLIGLTRGDSYLQDAEGGELDMGESGGVLRADVDVDELTDGFGGAI